MLDWGCGSADLCFYLRKRAHVGDYYGIDIVPDMVEKAQQRLDEDTSWRGRVHNLNQVAFMHNIADPLDMKADYCLLSGTLNDRIYKDNDMIVVNRRMAVGISKQLDYVQRVIENMWNTCELGVAFNLRSSWAWEPLSPEIMQYDPLIILRHCRKYTTRLALTHSYLPHDFTVYMFKPEFGGDGTE